MRRLILSGSLGIAQAGALLACAPEMGPTVPKAGAASVAPSWLPPYSPMQRAMLRSKAAAPRYPTLPVYPDLTRFGYAPEHVLADPRGAIKMAEFVANIVERSPRTYELLEMPPGLENSIAQYGPRLAEPDPWKIAVIDGKGGVFLESVAVPSEARAMFEASRAMQQKGERKEARQALVDLTQRFKNAPAPFIALGEIDEKDDAAAAERAYRAAIAIDPTLSSPHLGLARVLKVRGDIPGARIALSHALAYDPSSAAGAQLAKELAKTDSPTRTKPYDVFVEIDSRGAIVAAAPPTIGAQMYAGCRAMFRYEPEVRTALMEAEEDTPYHLSAQEEIICIEAAIGAFVVQRAGARQEGEPPPRDEQTEALLRLAHTDGLLGYVMFEIFGRHRPDRVRMAPASVHEATRRYVEHVVLGLASDEEPLNVARLDPARGASR